MSMCGLLCKEKPPTEQDIEDTLSGDFIVLFINTVSS